MLEMGNLRSALHAAPSKEAWGALCALLEEIASNEEAEQATSYILPHLRHHWPSNLRTLPSRWLVALVPAESRTRYRSVEENLREKDEILAHFTVLIGAFSASSLVPALRNTELQALFQAHTFPSLEHLDLAGRSIWTDEFPFVRELIARTPSLHHLDLRGTFLSRRYLNTDKEIENFVASLSPHAGQLRSLELGLNKLTSNELEGFLARPELRGLTRLSLTQNELDDRFIDLLLAAPLARELKHLDLSHNRISRHALDALSHPDVLPDLRTFDARAIALSLEAQARLEARRVQVIRQNPDEAIEIILSERGGITTALRVDGPEGTIGRVQGNDIILPKGNVSKRHIFFMREGDTIFIEDTKSTGGTYVNGHKICGPTIVLPQDQIYIGDFIIQMRIPDPATMHEVPTP